MTLDSMARIFQNLNGAEEDVEVEFADDGKALVGHFYSYLSAVVYKYCFLFDLLL